MQIVHRAGVVNVVKDESATFKNPMMRIRAQSLASFEGFFPVTSITQKKNGVYKFYIVVSSESAMKFVEFLMENIDYTSFGKSAKDKNTLILIKSTEMLAATYGVEVAKSTP